MVAICANKRVTSMGFVERAVTLPTKRPRMPACLRTRMVWVLTLCVFTQLSVTGASAQGAVAVSDAPSCPRVIDGFGTTAPPKLQDREWVRALYYADLRASVLRVDMTPRFRAPVSARLYHSPWFHGTPALPGPEGNNVRTYRDARDYVREWDGEHPQIAVMGPDIERNLARFDYAVAGLRGTGELAREGARRARRRGDFKLIGSVWSPAPWLKLPTGDSFSGSGDVMPKAGTPWPFVWAGNFAGGALDTSDQPRAAFDDGTGPTSALTQFARGTAAYVLGFQRAFGVRFYALSLQNELNFETFYNSCSYPQASAYIAALKALRSAFDAHRELAPILLIGPEDLLGADAYALWQFGSDPGVHKNLQYAAAIAQDPAAAQALGFFAVHAYASDGVNSAGNDEQMWRWWGDGWNAPPAKGLPERVAGTRAYGKKSWMTEMSGEPSRWLPEPGGKLGDSALGLAIKVHHALTTGQQSAWLYWQLLDGKPVSGETLTDDKLRARAPKYVAFKHFARFIRPGACVSQVSLTGDGGLLASAYRHPDSKVRTLVLINPTQSPRRVALTGLLDAVPAAKLVPVSAFVSQEGALWQRLRLQSDSKVVTLALPAGSVATVTTQDVRK